MHKSLNKLKRNARQMSSKYIFIRKVDAKYPNDPIGKFHAEQAAHKNVPEGNLH